MFRNNTVEIYDDNVVVVSKITDLPYAYIPFSSFRDARIKYPNAKLYVYEGKSPVGYKIVALPIRIKKPEEDVVNE